MPFVKIDCGILDSTLWIDRDAREVFLTALLMAEPREFDHEIVQISLDSTEPTGWVAPPGWYGFVDASAVGIIRRASIDVGGGVAAMTRLGSPDALSRTAQFEGRRLIRIDGGFVVLNFMKYRDRDYSGAERTQRYRERLLVRRTTERFGSDWDAVVAFYGGLCAYCEKYPWVDMDHVVATSKGGKHELANIVPACKSCNSSKKTDTWTPKKRHPFMVERDASQIRDVTQAEAEAEADTEVPSTSGESTYRTGSDPVVSRAGNSDGHGIERKQGNGANEPNALPRDHSKHSICGGPTAKFCLTYNQVDSLASRYRGGTPEETRAALETFYAHVLAQIPEGKVAGDMVWLLKHFDAWLIQIGRVAPEPVKAKPKRAMRTTAELLAERDAKRAQGIQ